MKKVLIGFGVATSLFSFALISKAALKYNEATSMEMEMRGLTETFLRVNKDDLSRGTEVRRKLNELKEKRETIAGARMERTDGDYPCSTQGSFTIYSEVPLINYDNYINSKNNIYSYFDKNTGKEIAADQLYKNFQESEKSSRTWLHDSTHNCAWSIHMMDQSRPWGLSQIIKRLGFLLS